MGSTNFENGISQNSLAQIKNSLLYDPLYAQRMPPTTVSYPQPPSLYVVIFDWCDKLMLSWLKEEQYCWLLTKKGGYMYSSYICIIKAQKCSIETCRQDRKIQIFILFWCKASKILVLKKVLSNDRWRNSLRIWIHSIS